MLHLPAGTARTGQIRMLPDVLRERRLNPQEIFAEAGVDLGRFVSVEGVIAYRDLGRLVAIAASRLGCAHLGLLIGQRCGLAELGLIGSAAAHAPNVGTALGDFVIHMPYFDNAAVVSVAVERDAASFCYVMGEPDFPGAEHIREGSLAVMMRVLRDLCGPAWTPDVVQLTHRARGPVDPYRRYFRCPVEFGAGAARILFPARQLARPVHSTGDALRRAVLAQAEALEQSGGVSWTLRVRRHLLKSQPHGQADEADTAAALGLDASTLRRKLAREGTSFRSVGQGLRHETSQHLLRESDLMLSEIALALGYAELSVFTRAFRRWSGMTPSAWRKQMQT